MIILIKLFLNNSLNCQICQTALVRIQIKKVLGTLEPGKI